MKKKRRKSKEEVELNMAAMLDMAFQLLTFFILTFKPAPIEGQVSLRLPPPQPVTQINSNQQAGSDTSNTDPVQGLKSLIVSVFSSPNGNIVSMGVGEGAVSNLSQLDSRLKAVFSDKNTPFEQVIIQVSAELRYEELMRVIDVCTRQTLPSGDKLTKFSFVELPVQK